MACAVQDLAPIVEDEQPGSNEWADLPLESDARQWLGSLKPATTTQEKWQATAHHDKGVVMD